MSVIYLSIKCSRCGKSCDSNAFYKFKIGKYAASITEKHTWDGVQPEIKMSHVQVNGSDHAYCEKCYADIRKVMEPKEG